MKVRARDEWQVGKKTDEIKKHVEYANEVCDREAATTGPHKTATGRHRIRKLDTAIKRQTAH